MSPLLLKMETAPTREETWMTQGSAGQSAEMAMCTLKPRHGPDTHMCAWGLSGPGGLKFPSSSSV